MRYDFDTCPDRRSTESQKWQHYEADVLPLWVADMDFPSPAPVIRALTERVHHGVFGYTTEPEELRQVIVERLARLYQWRVQPEEVLIMPGVIHGVNLACRMLGSPGEGALVQPPVYTPILQAPGYAGLQCQEAVLTRSQEGHYEIDWETFETAITPQTRLFILCNPHNPVGRVYRKEEIAHMAEICLRHGVVVCSDEIHCDLIFSGHRHFPIASLDREIAQNTVTLMSPTKTFNIAGLQCSFAIVPNEKLRQKLQGSMRGLVMWVNLIGLNAALAAYRDGQEWLDQVLAYMELNRDFLFDYVHNQLPELSMAKPEGTYLAWLDCRNTAIQGNPFEFLLKEARVAFNDGMTFGGGGEGFVRLNFACSRQVLSQALDRVKDAVRKVGG